MYKKLEELKRDVDALSAKIEDAMLSLKGRTDDADQESKLKPSKNPAYFKENGIHLSAKGIEQIEQLFEEGYSNTEVAKEMCIDKDSASRRRRMWRNK